MAQQAKMSLHIREFSKMNHVYRKAIRIALDEVADNMVYTENDINAHIGCASGEVTVALAHFLLKRTGKTYGFDTNEEKILKARAQFPNIEKLEFVLHDIEGEPQLLAEYKEKFDHVFAFFRLNWVQNHQRAFENIGNMLKPGGVVLMTFFTKSSIYDSYKNLVQREPWSQYAAQFEECFSTYLSHPRPDDKITELAMYFGDAITCHTEDVSEHFDVTLIKDFICVVCRFIQNLPQDVQQRFRNEMIGDMRARGLVDGPNVHMVLKFLICTIKKRVL